MQWKEHYLRYTQLKKLIGKLFPKNEKRRVESKRGDGDGEDDGEGDPEEKDPEENRFVLNYQSDDVSDRYTGQRVVGLCARSGLSDVFRSRVRVQITELLWSLCAVPRTAKRR